MKRGLLCDRLRTMHACVATHAKIAMQARSEIVDAGDTTISRASHLVTRCGVERCCAALWSLKSLDDL